MMFTLVAAPLACYRRSCATKSLPSMTREAARATTVGCISTGIVMNIHRLCSLPVGRVSAQQLLNEVAALLGHLVLLAHLRTAAHSGFSIATSRLRLQQQAAPEMHLTLKQPRCTQPLSAIAACHGSICTCLCLCIHACMHVELLTSRVFSRCPMRS